MAGKPIAPFRRAAMIIEWSAAAHEHERRIAYQRRDPASDMGVGAADMRVQRFDGEHVAYGCEGDINQEQNSDQERR